MSQRNDVIHPTGKAKLKQAFRELTDEAGGQEKLAKLSGRGQQRISFWGHPNSDAFPPIDVIADAEDLTRRRTGWPHVTRVLCTLNDGVFVPLPPATGVSTTQIHAALALQVKEHSDVVGRVLAGLAAKRRTPAQLAEIITELDQEIAAAVQLRALHQAMLDEA